MVRLTTKKTLEAKNKTLKAKAKAAKAEAEAAEAERALAALRAAIAKENATTQSAPTLAQKVSRLTTGDEDWWTPWAMIGWAIIIILIPCLALLAALEGWWLTGPLAWAIATLVIIPIIAWFSRRGSSFMMPLAAFSPWVPLLVVGLSLLASMMVAMIGWGSPNNGWTFTALVIGWIGMATFTALTILGQIGTLKLVSWIAALLMVVFFATTVVLGQHVINEKADREQDRIQQEQVLDEQQQELDKICGDEEAVYTDQCP